MSNDVIKIFVGCDPNNCDLEQMMVLDYSIRKNTQYPVEITWMQLSHDINSPWYSDQETGQGWSTAKWATPFSGFRWAIPELCDFKGRAIYMDADVIVLTDIAELWNTPFDQDAMVIAKGKKSTARLCTCVWNCEEAKKYLPPLQQFKADPDGHKKLMKLIQEKPQLVQNYTSSYNCIDGEELSIGEIKILHYSDMGTQFSHKYSVPRLKLNNQKHWFDGKILPHPRQDLAELFDQYYQNAIDAGYSLENYKIPAYGDFIKASQINYHGNKITRPKSDIHWLNKTIGKIKAKFKTKKFTLDD
ncbi:glycosyltransferase [Acinetobacter sp.]|jgi:hypothetical protein|uniref:glycosyltransferase n=1 Tax=Acinetobacter sp. TaxID=472 RepID=UPI0028359301|nr:glycosyltransferase [Acinetobacter sp.]MDR0236819.1 glycosyl transferase [Acinetobacter sp.]